jgi:hypothetical protein
LPLSLQKAGFDSILTPLRRLPEFFCLLQYPQNISTLNIWRSDLQSLLEAFGSNKLHTITPEAIMRYVQHLQITPIPAGLRNGGQVLSDKSIRNRVGLLSQILRAWTGLRRGELIGLRWGMSI